MRKKIFMLVSRVPYPIEKGDKLRAFYQIRELSRTHDVILCALSDSPVHRKAREVLRPYVKELHIFRLAKPFILLRLIRNFLSDKPFQVAYFFSTRIRKKIHDLLEKTQPDHIYCQLIRTAEYVKDLKDHDKTIDYQDVLSQGLFRRLVVGPWYLKFLLRMEYQRVKSYEGQVFDRFEKRTIISYPDRTLIPHPKRDEITVIPNGVDFAYFRPTPLEKSYDIIFSGNMGYPPNINGALYLVNQIMPYVWEEMPDVRVVIAGANPSQAVLGLASDQVTVTGWVEDMREYYSKSKVFVAPMQIGTGLQNKVLEAMAMELPCITSHLANKALGASPGKEILIGTDPGDYAQQIVSLLNDTAYRQQIADGGKRYVSRNFQWSAVCSRLEAVITG